MATPIAFSREGIYGALKYWYRDGIEDVFFRASPVLMNMEKQRFEGEAAVVPVITSRGGADGADWEEVKKLAATTGRTKAFKVQAGRVFTAYTITQQEVLATKTDKYAFMKATGLKFLAATNGLRQTMAAALYGSGWGELCQVKDAVSVDTATASVITLPYDTIVKIDVEQILEVKKKINDTTTKGKVKIEKINGDKVSVKAVDNAVSIAANDWLCIAGGIDTTKDVTCPAFPVGLGGWLPDAYDRDGADWETYIAEPFFEVDRSVNADKLAGHFVKVASGESYVSGLKQGIKLARRNGSNANLIVLNDNDFGKVADEMEATSTFFTQTGTIVEKEGTAGFSRIASAFSTNFIQNIWDDANCPEGKFYILDQSEFVLLSYTNAEKPFTNGIPGNNPGKQDPMTFNDEGKGEQPHQLLLDDYIVIEDGVATPAGPAVLVGLSFYGSFAVYNPSNCVVGKFAA